MHGVDEPTFFLPNMKCITHVWLTIQKFAPGGRKFELRKSENASANHPETLKNPPEPLSGRA